MEIGETLYVTSREGWHRWLATHHLDRKEIWLALYKKDCGKSSISYDVSYWFCNVESFVFWLKAVPLPEDFDISKHWREVGRIITEYSTSKGIETNEHRELIIVRKIQSR